MGDPFDMPLFKWLHEYLRNISMTTYGALFILFGLVTVAISVLFTWIMDNYFSELKNDFAFLGMFRFVEFLAVQIFLQVVADVMQGYNSPIRAFRNHLSTIIRVGIACNSQEELYPLLSFLIDAADGKYRPEPLDNFERLEERQLAVPFEPEFRNRFANKHTLDSKVRLVLTELNNRIKTSNQRVWDNLDFIAREHQETDAQTFILQQNYTNQSHTLFLVAWFGVWLPIYMWASTDTPTTIAVFPIVCLLLWGVFLQRWWLGSPWHHGRPFPESTHEKWPLIYKKQLADIFKIKEE